MMLTTSEEEKLRRAVGVMVETTPIGIDLEDLDMTGGASWRGDRSPRRTGRRPLVVAMGAAVATLILSVPVVFLGGDGSDVRGPAISPDPVTTVATSPVVANEPLWASYGIDETEIHPEVRDYWALQGSLGSLGDEDGWLCPVKGNFGYAFMAPEESVPDDLVFADLERDEQQRWYRDNGPSCVQPHLLVLLATPDPNLFPASAGMTVWPSTTRFFDLCDPESCGTSAESSDVVIAGQPALLLTHDYGGDHELWWTDVSGVPLYARASGLTGERVVELATAITVDALAHGALIDPAALDDLRVVSSQTRAGVWESGLSRSVVYNIDGAAVAVKTRYDSAFDPTATLAENVTFLELVELSDRFAVWVPEGGNFLSFRLSDWVMVSIEGAPSAQLAIAIADSILEQLK